MNGRATRRMSGHLARALTVGLLVLGTAACGDSTPSQSGEVRAPAPDDRREAPAAGEHARRSQPYWVPVASLHGSGSTTTRTFEIDRSSLQWRISWNCQSAPFTVVGVDSKSKVSARKLAYALSCPSGGQGFSADAGRHSLKVTGDGDWRIDVEQQVDVPLLEPAGAAVSASSVVAQGKVYGIDKDGEGTARVHRQPDGALVLRLEGFYVSKNSDLEIRLSTLDAPISTGDVVAAPFKIVAGLKATVGNMNYDLPRDVDLAQYRAIVIWCEITRNAYAAASMSPP